MQQPAPFSLQFGRFWADWRLRKPLQIDNFADNSFGG